METKSPFITNTFIPYTVSNRKHFKYTTGKVLFLACMNNDDKSDILKKY